MKKYIKPEVELLLAETVEMIASSGIVSLDNTAEFNGTLSDEAVDQYLSRDFFNMDESLVP